MAKRDVSTQSKARRSKFGLFRFLFFLLALCGVILLSGFVFFAHSVSTQQAPENPPKADGIVVLTGSGGGRLEAAANLLRSGYGERLLISGVNPENAREDVLAVLDLPPELAQCCVDFDYAQDTIENASETAIWTQALAFEHIILVTSAYHMPRSQVEISGANGRIKITPYPVQSYEFGAWWKDKNQTERLGREYAKLLLSYVREPSGKAARKPLALEPQTSETQSTEGQSGAQ